MGEKFNPNEHLRTLTRRKKIKDSQGEHWITENHVYLDVKWRLIWFRSVYPDGFIQTVEAEVTEIFARIEAVAFDKDPAQGGKKLGMGRRCVASCDFKDYVEKAETQAIGRALAVAGFGTQFCEEFDEDDILADSPIEAKQVKPHSAAASAPPVAIQAAAPEAQASTRAPEKPMVDANHVYDAALRKGLSRNDTDLLVTAKYHKISINDLTTQELDEFVSGIKETSVNKLRDFVDRYKASLEQKQNAAVA